MTDQRTSIDPYTDLWNRVNRGDLPEHRREQANRYWTQVLGYAWGRQDEAGRMDHDEAWTFAIWATGRKVDYLTERVSMLPPICDLWDDYHEEKGNQ